MVKWNNYENGAGLPQLGCKSWGEPILLGWPDIVVFIRFARVFLQGVVKRDDPPNNYCQQLSRVYSSWKKRTHTYRNAYTWTHMNDDNRFVDTVDYSKDYSSHANSWSSRLLISGAKNFGRFVALHLLTRKNNSAYYFKYSQKNVKRMLFLIALIHVIVLI